MFQQVCYVSKTRTEFIQQARALWMCVWHAWECHVSPFIDEETFHWPGWVGSQDTPILATVRSLVLKLETWGSSLTCLVLLCLLSARLTPFERHLLHTLRALRGLSPAPLPGLITRVSPFASQHTPAFHSVGVCCDSPIVGSHPGSHGWNTRGPVSVLRRVHHCACVCF